MIFRDDDICNAINLDVFKQVDELFIKYGVQHHIAVIVKDIDQNPALIDYINSHPHIIPQFHCWDHVNYPENHELLVDHFVEGVALMKKVFGKAPTVWYPTWNKSDTECERVADSLGMKTSFKKISISQYIRFKGSVGEDVINFHYWCTQDQNTIEGALKIFTGK